MNKIICIMLTCVTLLCCFVLYKQYSTVEQLTDKINQESQKHYLPANYMLESGGIVYVLNFNESVYPYNIFISDGKKVVVLNCTDLKGSNNNGIWLEDKSYTGAYSVGVSKKKDRK